MHKNGEAPYGSWKSPITSDLIISGATRFDHIAIDGDAVYWTELRPSENGRLALVKWTPDGGLEDATPPEYNARTRVHEYGGAAFTVHDEAVYFTNFTDQRLYVQYEHGNPEPVTPAQKLRFADFLIDPGRGRLYGVREDHTIAGQEAGNTLISLDLDTAASGGDVLASGNDFYASPRLSPVGRQLAWLTWNHPNMPWDGTELWVGDLNKEGTALTRVTRVAGGESESIFQPEWSPGGDLYFISDRSNWWNIYRWRHGEVENLCPKAMEFGVPQWVFGLSQYGFVDDTTIVCAYRHNDGWQLARLSTTSGELTDIDTPYTTIHKIQAGKGFVVFYGGSATIPGSIVRFDLGTNEGQILNQTAESTIDPAFLSMPRPIEFPTENGLTAHAFYYPPQNRDFVAPAGERPPLLVFTHGGPTGSTDTTFKLGIQYWTSRGFAVVDVNYGGSTGYGREYRQRLNGQWGMVDVQDCVNAALYLVEQGLADGRRLAIRGGSAGGYTTLRALTYSDVFSAGASHFGVSDAGALAEETHKFESRYLDSLIGPYPARRDLYIDRSPIHHTDQINCPLILFQGLEDKVVPPNQAEMMFDAVRARGVPVAYVPFAGEQHGFRRAENIKRAIEGELYFYSKVFDFELAEPVPPVSIENLD